ncbi:MAG: hypothetical protein V5B40_10490 [Candidatus Accumulibacter meliphilus]|uniref:hypothetical protein n=1 Tax=Candidatus Accumulibacter meliphilus TaxID=2211374 RepID=UPI002FC3C8D1
MAELQAQLDAQAEASVAARKLASLGGSGAIAQRDGDALGERAAQISGDNAGTIVTGTQIISNYYAAGSTGQTREQIAEQVAGYLRWLRERTACIELRGIELAWWSAGGASAA